MRPRVWGARGKADGTPRTGFDACKSKKPRHKAGAFRRTDLGRDQKVRLAENTTRFCETSSENEAGIAQSEPEYSAFR